MKWAHDENTIKTSEIRAFWLNMAFLGIIYSADTLSASLTKVPPGS
jgi:hypothetical protein